MTERSARNTLLQTGLTISMFLTLMAACAQGGGLPVEVLSLTESLPDLEEAARTWRADAYLESVSVRLLDGGSASYLIWANFNSPSAIYESLVVRLLSGGSVSVETYDQAVPVSQVEPIEDDDWELDSADALERALDHDGRRYLEELTSLACSHLVLTRMPEHEGRVVWRLNLADCLDPWTSQEAIIDAMSGEVISREVHDGLTPLVVPTP